MTAIFLWSRLLSRADSTGIKGLNRQLYAHRLKLAVIAEGKGHDGAHVIVDHAHIHARFCLFLEDLHGIPHDAMLQR